MSFLARFFEWLSPVERWLGRIHLYVWIIGGIIGIAAQGATVTAGITQAIPPYWLIPACLAALALPLLIFNQAAVARERWRHLLMIDHRPHVTLRAFPKRTAVALLAIVLGIIVPPVLYFLKEQSNAQLIEDTTKLAQEMRNFEAQYDSKELHHLVPFIREMQSTHGDALTKLLDDDIVRHNKFLEQERDDFNGFF
jgi:hypothetical protein